MDTQVKYILLLLVITVISIGVSSSVKYDKSSIETHPDMPKAHTPDDNHSGLSQETQNKVKLLQSQFTNLNQEVASLETTLNNTVPILNSDGNIVLELGSPTLADVNKLFISESINDTQDYGLWKYFFDTFTVEENSGSYRLKFDSDQYINLNNINPGLTASGVPSNFNFDSSGFLQNVSNEYLVFDNPPNPSHGSKYTFTTESRLVDAYGKYVLKLINSTTADKFSLAVVKLLTTPKQTQLYNLEYFGLTDNTNLPPPFLQNQYISKSSPFALSDIKQIPSSFTNTLGIFATISTANNPTTVTPADFIGLDENITSENYAINVLNVTTPIPDNYILPVHSTTPSYTIPTTGKPFYSIHLLMLNDTFEQEFTIQDQNNTKGVQNIVIVCSSRQYNQSPQGNIYHNSYGILERRGTVDFITNDTDTINAAFSQKQLYNMFANYNIVSMVVFPLCYEHSEKLQSATIRDYGVSYAQVPTNYLTFNSTSGSFNQQYSYVWDDTDKTYTKYKHTDPNVANSWVID